MTDPHGMAKLDPMGTVGTFYPGDHKTLLYTKYTGPRSAVGNVSDYRCVSDCRSRGREFDPGPVPYFRGD